MKRARLDAVCSISLDTAPALPGTMLSTEESADVDMWPKGLPMAATCPLIPQPGHSPTTDEDNVREAAQDVREELGFKKEQPAQALAHLFQETSRHKPGPWLRAL